MCVNNKNINKIEYQLYSLRGMVSTAKLSFTVVSLLNYSVHLRLNELTLMVVQISNVRGKSCPVAHNFYFPHYQLGSDVTKLSSHNAQYVLQPGYIIMT